MADAVFNKSTSSELYLYQNAGQAPANYVVAFLQAPSVTTFPASITLVDSWTDAGGLYLFLNTLPTDQSAFVTAVRQYQESPALSDARFLWIENPQDNAAEWITQYLPVVPGASANTWKVAAATQVSLRNYVLSIAAECAIALDSSGGADSEQFVITRNNASDFSFSSGQGRQPLTGLSATIAIDFAGALIGCYTFGLTIAQSNDATSNTEIGRLDTGLKYFYDQPGWQSFGYLSEILYPVLSPVAAAIQTYPSLDPINSGLASRSFLSFIDPQGSAAPAILSYLKTWVGRAVNLQPKTDGEPKLVFLPSPKSKTDGDQAPYYLAPSGQFTIEIPPLTGSKAGQNPATESDSATRLVCGSSPAEYLGYLEPASPASVANVVQFVPGQNAYASDFDPSGSGEGEGHAGNGLQADATTSYVAIQAVGVSSINYYSQPTTSLFYDPPATPVTSDDDYLDYTEIISRTLPALNTADPATSAFPMVALAGLEGFNDIPMAVLFENQTVSQARRDAIQAFGSESVATDDASMRNATTRHGMLGQFEFTSPTEVSFQQVTLARSDAGVHELVLAGANEGAITGVLRSALQSNELFLVISDQAAFEQNGSFISSILTIANIPFNLAPNTWASNKTIIVYKYAGDTIEALANDLNAWAFPTSFTQTGLTQAELIRIINDIKAKHQAGDSDFDHVYEAVTNPSWNGILAFNTEVSLASIPGQLSGLAAGIDASAFNAHHLGINISPMEVTNGVLTMKDTALFGLIDYEDDSPFANSEAAYDFKVRVLKILFGNSEIKNFSARIDLLVNQLFGIPVNLDPPADPTTAAANTITLNGFYQKQAAGDTFIFVSNDDLIFKATSELLDEVEITHAQFITDNPNAQPDANHIKPIATRFSFVGELRFKDVTDFDALSFGSSDDGMIKGGLSFSNMVIHMDYDQNVETEVITNRVFTFNAGNLAIDLSVSRARTQSLYSHFPLKFTGFIQGQGGTNPADLGYLACSTPISESALSFPWYGLQYELNLGTVGSLAGSAGFTATLLIAWSPGSGLPLFTGLKLPGVSPQSLSFSLQGLLSISIDDFRFQTDHTPQGQTAYTLVFSNLGLRVFGIKLPPSAYIDFVLFGNPDPGRKAASLGWYAAYVSQE